MRKRKRPGSSQEQAAALAQRTIDHLEFLLGLTEAAVEQGELTPQVVRESAGVARALTQLMGELRQQEKHHRMMIERLTTEERIRLVFEFVRTEATGETRAEFRRLLDELDQAEHILS